MRFDFQASISRHRVLVVTLLVVTRQIQFVAPKVKHDVAVAVAKMEVVEVIAVVAKVEVAEVVAMVAKMEVVALVVVVEVLVKSDH